MSDYQPNEAMQREAQRGLDWRREFGRGGTEVGIARARDIVNGKNLSDDTVKRMYSFFSRHEVDKQAEGFRPGEEGYPSNGRIAWALWGGDAGYAWAKDRVEDMDDDEDENRAAPDALKVGDFVEWNSSGGKARGQIEHIMREGTLGIPDSEFSIEASEDDPAALIRIYRDGEPTETLVGHKFSTLTKTANARVHDDLLREDDFNAIPLEEATGERSVSEEVIEEIVPEVDEADRREVTEIVHRAAAMEAKIIDEEKRTAHIAVSSELAVERSFGKEILVHDAGSINLEFLRSGRAPLLLDHDMEKQIGVIESVELSDDRRLRAKVRFGRSALAQEVFQDVVDGIRSNISVGYRINKMERSSTNKDEYLVRAWSPMEVSVVSIPADPSVGVGRSAAAPEPQPLSVEPSVRKEDKMSEVDLDAVRAEAAKVAARNAADIVALGARHNAADLAQKALAEGKSIDQFRGELLDVIGNKPLENKEIGLNKKERQDYSIVRAIRALANPTDRGAQEAARFELEASAAAARAYGTTAQGIMVPAEVLGSWKRDLNTSDDNEIVATNLMAGDFIDVLRNSSSVMQAGARMMQGLVGNVAIPKKTAASSAGWISTEGGASSESEPTFGTVSLSPKTVGAFSDMTRQLILQSTPSIEALVRDDLTQALALAIDAGALKGTGLSGQPTGIYSTSGINTDSFTGATPTWAEIVGLETLVAEDNALLGNLAYIAPASLYGTLKTTAKATNQAIFAVDPDGSMNGYRTIVSNQATAGYLLFGNFSDCLIGMWGGLDLTVDPYTSSNTGTVRVVALQSVDVAVRHAVSFALGTPAA